MFCSFIDFLTKPFINQILVVMVIQVIIPVSFLFGNCRYSDCVVIVLIRFDAFWFIHICACFCCCG